MRTLLFILLFIGAPHDILSSPPSESEITTIKSFSRSLTEGRTYLGPQGTDLNIYCHKGAEYSYLSLWKSVYIQFTLTPTEFQIFEGNNAKEVEEQYESHKASWLPLLLFHSTSVSFPAFEEHCIGISTTDKYSFEFHVRIVNYWKVLQLLAGISLFLSVPSLCRNAVVYYSGGITLGVIASLLIVVFLVGRLLPRKSGAYTVIFFGWSIVVYFIKLIFTNTYQILVEYRSFVIGYIVVSALISFAVCYRCGPPTNPRTINLLQWSVQLVSLMTIFTSSEIREVTTAIIITLLSFYNFPALWSAKLRTFWRRRFPPKIKLLTEEEYISQADEETRKALGQLREFCRSPECNAWKLTSRLKNPVRFSDFVLGGSHLEDSEILDYETDLTFVNNSGDTPSEDDSEEEYPRQNEATELMDD